MVTVYDLATMDRVARLEARRAGSSRLPSSMRTGSSPAMKTAPCSAGSCRAKASLLTRRSAHADPITSIAVSRDGGTIASADSRGIVRIWSADDLGDIAATKARPGGVNDVTFTPSGEIVAAGNDGMVSFWTTDGERARDALVVDPEGDSVRSTAVTRTARHSRSPTRTASRSGISARACSGRRSPVSRQRRSTSSSRRTANGSRARVVTGRWPVGQRHRRPARGTLLVSRSSGLARSDHPRLDTPHREPRRVRPLPRRPELEARLQARSRCVRPKKPPELPRRRRAPQLPRLSVSRPARECMAAAPLSR